VLTAAWMSGQWPDRRAVAGLDWPAVVSVPDPRCGCRSPGWQGSRQLADT